MNFQDVKDFTIETLVAAKNKILDFCKGVKEHWQSITICTLASVGLSAILGEVPFYAWMPLWFEASMVTPVIAVIVIILLLKSAERKVEKNNPTMAVA